MCRADTSLPYYECEPGRHVCTAAGFAAIVETLTRRVKAAFPDSNVQDFQSGHLTVDSSNAIPSPAGKIVDFSPCFVMGGGSKHVNNGYARKCSDEYGGWGWPCTRWEIGTIFPLARCFVDGVVVPCAADVATYSTLDNQAEYVDDGHLHCHGCSKCLLWGDDAQAGQSASVSATVAAMQELERCGFANMLSLVPTLVKSEDSGALPEDTFCGCGIIAKGRGC
jgi:hypothetical protein